MDASAGAVAALRRAEDRLRAEGMTGGRALDALLDAVRARLGDPVDAHPVAVAAVASLPLPSSGAGDVDLLGLAYERFFPDLFKGQRGQFFTPRPLVELLLDVAGVGPGDDVLDPPCGSGGFLVCAGRRGARPRGIERDPALATLASLNLRLAGLPGDVRCADFFATDPVPADVVVANPPFSVVVDDPDVLARYDVGRERVLSDMLFLEALSRWVKPGGRAAIVMPWSLFTNPSWARLRERVDAAFVRTAACALPEGVFRPFGGAAGRAGLLWLTRRSPADVAPETADVACRWADVADPGWDVRLQRFKATSTEELDRLRRGEGWTPIEGWLPTAAASRGSTLPLSALARRAGRAVVPAKDPDRDLLVVDLADVDKATGEVPGAVVRKGGELVGPKTAASPGDVLVSKLRPALNNVALAPASSLPIVGSSEWIAIRPVRLPHFVLVALRTPAWRAQLATTGGQTRPRTTPAAVLGSAVPWPGDDVAAKIDAVAGRLHAERARLRAQLVALQSAMDAFASCEIDATELERRLDAMSARADG